jgi:hypothetical protein
MANIVQFTEQFDNSYHSKFDGLTVTSDTHNPPSGYGDLARMADTLSDPGGSLSSLFTTYETIINDSSDYIVSCFIRKDSNTSQFPELGAQFAGGTGLFPAISINTSTGAVTTASGSSVAASGSVNHDANWWRVWFRIANNNSGNTVVRAWLYPAKSLTLGGATDVGAVRDIVAWGINITQASSLEAYDPNPWYDSNPDWETLIDLGAVANSYSDTDVDLQDGVIYEYRVVAINVAGSSPSNIDEEEAVDLDQHFVPNSDVSPGLWTASSGSDLYATIDERPVVDTDYIQSPASPSNAAARFGLTDGVAPGTGSRKLRIRAKIV